MGVRSSDLHKFFKIAYHQIIMTITPMMDVLLTVEKNLPRLLEDEAGWNTVDVNYHPPRVERVWCYWEGHRINLHRIHPCERDEPYVHPHPWPSAMHVLSGSYEMIRGFGQGIEDPIILGSTILGADSYYSMEHRDEWHSVRPLEKAAYSLMVNGTPWDREMPIEQSASDLSPLTPEQKREILQFFREFYSGSRPPRL